MDRLTWISCLLVLLFCISATSTVYGDELSEGLVLINDGRVKDAPNLAIIITDGQSNINHEDTLPQAQMLKDSGVTILTVAVGFATHTDELIRMTSKPVEENIFSVDRFSGLDDMHTKIVEPICKDRYLCEGNPCKNGAECYNTLCGYICICAKGYFGPNCDKTCPQPADIAFVLDSSSSIGINAFSQMKSFVVNLVRDLEAEKCNHHISVMKYSSRPIVEFSLDRYHNQEAVIRAINRMSYTRGYANMANAMQALRVQIFNGRNGDRPTVKNIAYLLTDGQVDVAKDETLSQAELTISSGIHVVPIGFDLRNRDEVDSIAASQGIKSVEILSASDVGSLTESLLYAVFDCCNPNKDIAFILDSSSSIGVENFNRILKFVSNLVADLSHGNGKMRYALITYSTKGTLVFSFGRFLDPKLVKDFIERTLYTPGSTNTAAGLRNAVDAFSLGYGSRPDADNIAIVITDGYSNVDAHLTTSTADALKSKVKKVIGVGIGLTNTDELMAIASGETNIFMAT